MKEIELKLPSDPKLLKIIRSTINHITEICGFSPEDSNAVTIAVDEAAANIIKHTYGGDENQLMVVNFKVFDDQLQVVLRDFGDKVDPKSIKPRDLNEIRPGGLGVHLIKSTMDVVKYDTSLEVGNKLILIKYLPGKKEVS